MPSTLTRLSELRNLQVLGSPLTSLPADIGDLTRLKQLDLAGGRYSSLPPGIVRLTNLTTLHLAGPGTSRPRADRTGLAELPHDLGRLAELTELKVSGHLALSRIPDSVGQLQKLRSLDLHDCPKLTCMPESLAGLRSLQTLNLRNNLGLQTLPVEIGNLPQLRKLDLSGCTNLATLPPSLGNLPGECEIIVPPGLEQQLLTIRPRLATRPRTSLLRTGGTPHRGAAPRQAGPLLRRHRDRRPEWKNAMAQFQHEESAGSFSRWLDAVESQTEGTGGPSEREIVRLEEIVEAARTLPGFRSKLFSFAQTNVQIQRSAATGETVANPPPGSFAGVVQAHELLLEHKLSDPSLPADAARRICREAVRERCARMNVSEAVTMLVGKPQIPDGRGRLPGHKPWPPLARYVEAHDRLASHAVGTLADLVERLGLATEEGHLTENDYLEGVRHAQHANATVLHERYIEVARELLGENGASSSRM